MKVLILGASSNPGRYANMALKDLRMYDHQVIAVGNREGLVDDVKIQTELPSVSADIHTVTVYLSKKNQATYEDFIQSLKPKRVIFNPGAENKSLSQRLKEDGVEAIDACTLVMLRTNQF